MFEIKSYKKRFDANKVNLVEDIGHPYVVRQSQNNGQKGYIDEDISFLNDGNTISFGQDTATVFYQSEPYFTGDKIKILKSRNNKFSKLNALFFISAISKTFSGFSWGSSSYDVDTIKAQKIFLPTKNNSIDFEFMEKFIAELEAERIEELEAYLSAVGLKNIELTPEEEKILAEEKNIEWGEYRLGDLFTKLNLKFKHGKFDKKFDVSTEPTEEFNLPLINAKHGNNGIMFYGREKDWDSAEMTIDIVQNGAVATGDVYPQLQKTGVMWDAYLIEAKFPTTAKILYFLSVAIEKSIKHKFSYEFKASWERVSNEKIFLPTKNDEIDFEFMEKFITAIEKIIIRGVVEYSEKKIAAYRKAVS